MTHRHRPFTLAIVTLVLTACTTPTSTNTPTAPTTLAATPTNGGVHITFIPGDDRGSPIINHAYTTNDGATWSDFSPPIITSPATITGLANGTTYPIRLRASNAAGDGAASQAVIVTPRSVPDPPTVLTATPGNTRVVIDFTPGHDGGRPITNHAFSLDDGDTWQDLVPPVTTSPVTITRLTNGRSYVIRLRAANDQGHGAPSTSLTATPATTPGAPADLVAAPGDAHVQITFERGDDGGAAITNHAYSLDDGATWTVLDPPSVVSPITVTGLTNDASYPIRLRATNVQGSGSASERIDVVPLAPFTSIDSGLFHSLAIDGNGNGWAWGGGTLGQLGNGGSGNVYTAGRVILPSETTFTKIVGGNSHSVALDQNGVAWAWGFGAGGQLGLGGTDDVTTPHRVAMPPNTIFTTLAAGQFHTLAIDQNGNAWAWGNGAIGDGTFERATTPRLVSAPPNTSFTAISGGAYHSLAIDQNGHAWAWGSGSSGQLGNGSEENASTPQRVSMPTNTRFTSIHGGGFHSLAVDQNGNTWAWGAGSIGALGNGTPDDALTPRLVATPPNTTFITVDAGTGHSLAIDQNGNTWAWGGGRNGRLGHGSEENAYAPRLVATPAGTTFKAVHAGGSHSLAIDQDGNGWAWGLGNSGQLGNGSDQSTYLPTPIYRREAP